MQRTTYRTVKTKSSAQAIVRKILEYDKQVLPEDIEIRPAYSGIGYRVMINIDKVDIFGYIKSDMSEGRRMF